MNTIACVMMASLFYLNNMPITVLASFYGGGDGFHGKRTSCGEIFDRDALTFAHKELPPGTIGEFTLNGNRVIGICNDDGPFNHRDVDLSQAMFDSLTNGNLDIGVIEPQFRILAYKPRPTMLWNRFGTGDYEDLFREEIEAFINGDYLEIHKHIQPARPDCRGDNQRQLRFSRGHFCNCFISLAAKIPINQEAR